MAMPTDSIPTGAKADASGSPRPGGNAIEAGRGRKRAAGAVGRKKSAVAEAGKGREENSIRPAKRPGKVAESAAPVEQRREAARDPGGQAALSESGQPEKAQEATGPKAPRQRLVPEHVRKKFVQVGKHYYFADGARAFTDRGGRLTTPSENTEVIRSLVAIAEARRWSEITVRGTERFRKEAWSAARLAGLEVRGYRPTEFEQAHVVRTLARGKGGPSTEAFRDAPDGRERPDRSRGIQGRDFQNEGDPERKGRQGGLLTGKLVDHGRATYRHDPREAMSYFVTIETSKGDRTIWGVDLDRALKESLSRPEIGDAVGLRAVRQEAVKVRAAERDAEGKVVAEKNLQTHRNRWIVEKRGFFEARAEAARTLRDADVDPKQGAKRHPELVGTYLQVRAAELAAKQFRDPEDRERFVAQVRSALADAVARGEPLPPVRLRETTTERSSPRSRSSRNREPARARE